jgi:hypothetical protein
MGLAQDVNRAGYHIQEVRIVNAKGKRVSGFGTNVFLELTGGRYVTVGRSALSQLLFEKMRHGTETIFGDEIVSICHATGRSYRSTRRVLTSAGATSQASRPLV